jgi:hypothetical protein
MAPCVLWLACKRSIMNSVKLFFIIGTITASRIAFAGYGTNSFFVTLSERSTIVTPEAIADAKTSIECQPTKDDPSGHWGKEITGEQLSIRFADSVFRTNEPVTATIIYRHAGTNDNLNCTWMFGGDLDFRFVVKDESGTTLLDSFEPKRSNLPTTRKWVPGTQYKYQSNLTKRYGLSKPGTYSVSVHRRIRNFDMKLVDLSSGTATIKIAP